MLRWSVGQYCGRPSYLFNQTTTTLCLYHPLYYQSLLNNTRREREDRFNFAIARREPFFKQIIPLDSEVRGNTRYTNAVSFPADIGGLRSKINIFTAVYPFDFLSD